MKQRTLFSLCCVLAASVLLYSCGGGAKDALPVPKDAAFVLHLNTKSLNSKLTWDEIKQTKWFQDGRANATDSLAMQLMDNPEASGIDVKDEIVVFVKRISENEGFAVVTGRVKDAAAFEAFNKKLSKTNAAATKEGDITSMSLDKKVLVSWMGNKFTYVIDINTPKIDWSKMNDMQSDSIQLDSSGNVVPGTQDTDDWMNATPADLKGYTARLFKLKGDSLLVEDDRYSNLLKKDGDMHLWSNAEMTYATGIPMGMMSMLKLEKYFKDAVTTATLSFENGKIVMDAKSFSNDDMNALLKKYQGKEINADLIERIPSDSVLGVIAMNYPPQALKEFLKLGGLDGMANSFLGEAGITLDDFIAANKGDLVLAVTGFEWKEMSIPGGNVDGTPYTRATPQPSILFVNSIGNKAAFDKLVVIGKRFGENMNRNGEPFIFYNMNNDLFVAGTSQQLVDTYLQGSAKKNPAYLSKLKGSPFGAYVDLQNCIRRIPRNASDSASQANIAASLAMWQDVVLTGGQFNDGGIEQHLEVNLVDKNTNALKQLNQYADKMYTPRRGF